MNGFSEGAAGQAGPGHDRPAGETAGPDIAFPAGTGEQIEIVETQVVSGAPVPGSPGAPQVQYFLPPGRFLPPNRWRRHAHGWVWVVSVIAALIIVAATAAALVLGALSQYRFTASGKMPADCATRTALADRSIGQGARVQIFSTESGRRVADTRLDRFTGAEDGDGVCFLSFHVDRVHADGSLYLLRIGSAPDKLTSRFALERGMWIGR